jgi:hypothetical protein
MTRATFTVLFYIKRTKKLQDGTVPIYVRITVNGERSEWSLHKSIEELQWNKEKGCAQGYSKDARDTNSQLDLVKANLILKKREIEESGNHFVQLVDGPWVPHFRHFCPELFRPSKASKAIFNIMWL